MRLRFLALTLLAFAGTASAQTPEPEGEIYAAHGTEPFWGLTFEDGKMIYSFDEERIEVARPRPTTSRNGVHVYRTPRLTVEISHEGRCNDGMGEYEYPDTVRIRFGRSRGGSALEGCGGGILPPVTLMDTGWQIVDIDGTQVGGEAYELQFDADGIHARAGCNRLAGAYTQVGRTLTFGAIRSTRMACGDEPGTHERKVLHLLGGPVEISYRGGMIMTLQANRDGAITYMTLRRL
jgi:heat shock protein HslJ/uncharacterized membrane protein